RRLWPNTSRLSQRARSRRPTPIPCGPGARGSASTFRPARKISPPAGAMSPAMQRTSVVLPAPFSPASAMSSPGRTLRSTPSSARTAPNLTSSPDTVSSGAGASFAASGMRAGMSDIVGPTPPAWPLAHARGRSVRAGQAQHVLPEEGQHEVVAHRGDLQQLRLPELALDVVLGRERVAAERVHGGVARLGGG